MGEGALSDWRVRFQRIGRSFRVLFRSKMAVAGLALLLVYSITAAGAPLITPHDPQLSFVAGSFAPPVWMGYFSEGSRLSQNVIPLSRPGFPDQASIQEWAFQADPSMFSVSWAETRETSFTTPGSARIVLNRGSGLTGDFSASFKRFFNYPYEGPPYKFSASVAILAPTASPQEPVRARVFVERLATTAEGSQKWFVTDERTWDSYPFTKSGWNIPLQGLESNTAEMKRVLKVEIDPAALIFSSKGDYAFGVDITFTSVTGSSQQLEVFLDDLNIKLAGTSWGLLGTTHQGQDVFTQVVYGARISLLVGLLAAGIGIGLGLAVGLMAGYLGKITDEVLMRFTDMLLVIPGLPLLIVLVAVLGNSFGSSRLPILIIVIGFLGWMGFARVVRSQVLSLKERPFVEAAKAAGAGTGHITVRHIVPNIVGLIYVNLALAVPGAILAEAALSFLGLGDSTVMSWGRMLSEVQENNAQTSWWWVIPPGISIAFVSLSFVLIGYALDDIFNPKLRKRR